MKLKLIIFAIILSIPAFTFSREDELSIMFYNAENAFDTVDDPLKDDDEYTPDGSRRWTEGRYWQKIQKLVKVIAAVDADNGPDIIGMCEVENGTVLEDLTQRGALKSMGYQYLITDSPDKRGIDVALIYKRGSFRLISHESISVSLKPYSNSPTRDILHATGRIPSLDTLDIFVCHWPSRLGGERETEPLRETVAARLLEKINEVCAARRNPYIIVMGDLNEGPDGDAVRKVLGAKAPGNSRRIGSTTLLTTMDHQPDGSYRYQGEWDKYDQFIISGSLVNDTGDLRAIRPRIEKLEFLLEDDRDYGGSKPFRTYNGYKYQNGYSDHLPISIRISF